MLNSTKCYANKDHMVFIISKNHESLQSLICRNPYDDFAAYGAELQKLEICLRSQPNESGKIITGRAWFYGRVHTFGVNSYAEMITVLIDRLNAHYRWIHTNQSEKRRQYRERWEARHPGITFPWLEQHRKKDSSIREFVRKAV